MNKTSFKKLTSIVLAVLMLLSAFAVTSYAADTDANTTGASTVYFSPGDSASGNPAWFVWTWGTGEGYAVKGEPDNGLIRFDNVDTTMTIVRMPTGSTSLNWDSKWDQSEDIAINDNLYIFAAWSSTYGGKWTVTESHYDGGGDIPTTPTQATQQTQYSGDMRTILFTDNQGWGTVYVYAFANNQPVGTSWPGDLMSETGDDGYGNKQFSAQIPASATGVVFTKSASGPQTVDCDITDPDIIGFYTDGTTDGQGHYNTFSWGGGTPTEYTEPTEYTYPTTPTTPTTPTQPTQQTQPTQPTASTAPIVTEPASISSPTDPTAADEDTNLYVSAKSNVNTVGSKVKVTDNDIRVTYTLKTSEKIDDGQVSVSYDATKLSVSPVYNTASTMFPVTVDAFYNLNAATGVIVFNFSGINGKYDFTQDNQVLVNLVFTKKSPSTVGTATVFMNISELYSKDTKYVDDNVINTGASMSVGQTVEGITPTVPTETEASTAAENDITINASSNLYATAQTQHVTSANVKVTYKLTAPELISYGDATVTFDSTKLALESKYNTSETMFTTLNSNVSYRLNVANGVMKFNFTSVSSATHQGTYDFRTGGDVITLMFTVKAGATDTANVNLNFEQLGSIDTKYVENGAVVSAGAAASSEVSGDSTATTSNTEATTASIATAESTTGTQPKPTEPTQSTQTTEGTQATEPTQSTQTTEGTQATEPTQSTQTTEATQTTQATQATQSTQATQPTQSTQATQPQTQTPTQAYQTYITASADKKTIYVGATTRIYYSVTNPVGATTFKSSNTKVATVTSAGKVTGKKAGTVTISVKNNGKVATVKITVIKKTNPITAKGKTITIKIGKKAKKLSKNHKYARTKAITIKNAKGTVVYKKVKGNKKITVTSKGVVTVKKGLKKGTYKVRVKVTAKGNTTYKARDRYVYFTVKVKK